jgi:hypothetical protein
LCGSGVACSDCTTDHSGHACMGGHCGCRTSADCLPNNACGADGGCGSSCLTAGASGCNGGCCDPTMHTCSPGGVHADCGGDGGYCFNCAGPNGATCAPGGYSCVNQSFCGCYGTDQAVADLRCNQDCHQTGYHCSNIDGGKCEK